MRLVYRRPQVPWDVRGLFTALRSEEEGNAGPLTDWMGAGFGTLRGSLEAGGFDPVGADDAASEVVARALRAHRRGAVIRDECAWMSSVAGNLRVDAARARRSTSLSLSGRPA